MFSWEGQDVAAACAAVAARDPRHFRLALLTQSPWPDGAATALYWFHAHQELAQFLIRVEPRRWGVKMGELIAFKTRTQEVITSLEVTGIAEGHRINFNNLSSPAFGVRWWGTLETLKAGRGEWPRQVLQQLNSLPAEIDPPPLENRRVSELIQFLQRQYPAPAPGAG